MNWDKFIANLIYVLYMVLTVPIVYTTIALWQLYMNPAPLWHAVPMAFLIFLYILITMHIVYYLMPERWQKYWHDNPEKV